METPLRTPSRTPLSVVTAGALALALLGGCATESDAPDTTSPASTETAAPSTPSETTAAPGPSGTVSDAPSDEPADTPEGEAQALAVDYLEAIAAGDDEAAFALLSPESREWYTDATVFSSARTQDGSLTAEAAADVLTANVRTTEGPEGGFYVVTLSSGPVADSFVVRAEETGMVVDDPGVPTTGPTAWEWQNPAVGPDDDREPEPYSGSSAPTMLFATVVDAGGEVVVTPPASAFGVVDGTEVPVVVNPDEGEGALATVGEQLSARGQTVTIAWQAAPTSPMWRTSTVSLTP
ncbi:hypothetical protein [Sanguibacter keddieii]|uniref:hypothetical protein n=1 Tax=Sanguibacter keddieii TaxID=60920 RepID=UPI00117C5B60|nr:hypothetical protein [Sanguibacter keddieii]